MELFHIKIFKKPRKIFSVIYSVEPDIIKSHFARIEDHIGFLDRPGINPPWLDKVLEIQKSDLNLARKYVLKVIENEIREHNSQISVGFDWDHSEFKYDAFMSSALKFVDIY